MSEVTRINFNGIDLTDYLTVNEISGRGIFSNEVSTISVSGMDGAHFASQRRPVRELGVSFTIQSLDAEDLRLRIDVLNDILGVSEPVPIVFSDEPSMTYYGIPETSSENGEFVRWHQGSIKFLCTDPYKYGPSRNETFLSDTHTINYVGTANAKPIVEMTAKESVTFAMIQNNNDIIQIGSEKYPKYMMVGAPYEVDQTPFNPYPRRFYTDANTLVGWAKASNADIDGGVVTGEIISRNDRFVADSYGEGTNWHGPAIKTSVSNPLRDFRLTAFVSLWNRSQATMVGRVEIYLLDINGNAVCKMALKDTSAARANVFAELRAGDRQTNDMIIHEHGDRVGAWNDFSGQLRISREWDEAKKENIWSAYVAKVDVAGGRRHHTRRIVSEWRDGGKYTRTVTQIVVHIGSVGSHRPVGANSGVSSIILEEIVKDEEGIPYIAHAGDVITFDSSTGDALINGEPRNDLLDFGSDFIDLVKGENLLITHPNSFDTRLLYRNRFR